MGNPYPARFVDETGTERLTGDITFTDGGNQPGGSGGPVVASVSLAAAAVKTLNTVPVLVVPAPPSGSMNVPVCMVTSLHAGATPFDVGGTNFADTLIMTWGTHVVDDTTFRETDTVYSTGITVDAGGHPAALAGPINNTVDTVTIAYNNFQGTELSHYLAPTTVDGEAIYVCASADGTQGDGSLDVYILYYVITIT